MVCYLLMKGRDSQVLKQIGIFSTIGLTFVLSTFIGLGVGYFLDNKFKTSPWLTIIFLLFGIASGFVNLFRSIREISKDDDKRNNSEGVNK